MTKVALKIENITPFGGIYIISLWLSILPHWFGWGISYLCKNQETPGNPHINGLQNDDKWAVRGMSMGYVTRCLMRTVCMLLERGCRQEWKAGERDGERTERKAGRKTWKPQKKVLSLFSWESTSR